MRCFFILLLLVPALCVGPFVATGQEMDPTEAPEILAPTPAKVQLWTDKLGYNTGEQMSARVSLDPMGDTTEYKMFLYRENFKTAERLQSASTSIPFPYRTRSGTRSPMS